MKRPIFAATLSLVLAACLGDPVGPKGMLVVARVGAPDSLLSGAPGRPLPPVAFRLIDGDGRAIPGATVRWTVTGGNGHVDQADQLTAADGSFSVAWLLGTKAGVPQRVEAVVQAGSHRATASVAAVAV